MTWWTRRLGLLSTGMGKTEDGVGLRKIRNLILDTVSLRWIKFIELPSYTSATALWAKSCITIVTFPLRWLWLGELRWPTHSHTAGKQHIKDSSKAFQFWTECFSQNSTAKNQTALPKWIIDENLPLSDPLTRRQDLNKNFQTLRFRESAVKGEKSLISNSVEKPKGFFCLKK